MDQKTSTILNENEPPKKAPIVSIGIIGWLKENLFLQTNLINSA